MKDIYCAELSSFEELNHSSYIGKHDFAFIFGTTFLKAFTKDTIEAAF